MENKIDNTMESRGIYVSPINEVIDKELSNKNTHNDILTPNTFAPDKILPKDITISNDAFEYIIHPCETLKEILSNLNMTGDTLAYKTESNISYVNDLLNGDDVITYDFAVKLEHVLKIPASFWIKLQMNYNREMFKAFLPYINMI